MSDKKEKAMKNSDRPLSRNKLDSDVSGKYNTMVKSLLDIWTVLASASEPMTAGEVGKQMKNWDTSPQTVERRLNDSVDLINAVFPNTVLREEGKSAIGHTYVHNGALHVVVENPVGEPFWEGEMTAVFHKSATNPIPQPTLNRKIPELAEDYDDMKGAAIKKQRLREDPDGAPIREDENVIFTEGYPPISLAGVVAVKRAGGKTEYIPCTEYENRLAKKQEEADAGKKVKSPPRRFYLESILSPAEWQLLSDVILVYPYISEQETNKLISAMQRMAPGMRKWNRLIHAKKTPNALQFKHIRDLEECIQSRRKVHVNYGRYRLVRKLGGWKPELQFDPTTQYIADPYALLWSNGYYYLVCSVEQKDVSGQTVREMRNLRLDRIMKLTPTPAAFEMPKDFDVCEYRDRSPVMYPGDAVPITLRCHTSMLSVLIDFFGFTDISYSEPKDDYMTVSFEASENGTRLFALQYTDKVEVLEPSSLRQEVLKTLRASAARYEQLNKNV